MGATALALLSATAYAADRAGVQRDPVLSSAPQPAGVAVPVPAPAPVQRPSRRHPWRVDEGWSRRQARSTGIPRPAVVAYAAASLASPGDCRLGWTTLAGIGWVESQHGTIGGRVLSRSGRPSAPITGPRLDGTGGFARIAATGEGMRWHGDPHWEHAVGPLQFLPSTWDRWARDGDGDGVRDPQDLDDAALAAARYLCAAGGDLATPAGWTGAVLAYNHSREYLVRVHSAAAVYAERAG